MPRLASPSRLSRRFVIHPAPVHIAALLSLAGFAACKEQPRPQRPTPVVAVMAAAKGPLPYTVTVNGQVEPNRTVAVQALVSGQITRVGIAEGDEVSQGQVLFQIDPRPFRAELDRVQGTLSRDEATLARARGDSARFAALAKDGYVTKQQLDQVFAEASSLSATVAAGRASLERARFDLENTTVRAPISGRTGQIVLKAGALVRSSTDQLVTINELRPVLVRFSVPERDFEEMRRRAGLDKPLAVKITPNGTDSTRRIDGSLTFVDNQVDRATGSVLLKARVPNQDRALWPGQFVTVLLELSVDQDAITIPSDAVVTSGANTFVYVMRDRKAVRTPVKVGRQVGAIVKIDSGLVGGEQVITEGQTKLRDGAEVQLRSDVSAGGGAGGRGGRRGAGGGGAGRGDSGKRDSTKGDSTNGASGNGANGRGPGGQTR
jgi:multidrug efflux system membrane fusion protein